MKRGKERRGEQTVSRKAGCRTPWLFVVCDLENFDQCGYDRKEPNNNDMWVCGKSLI
jgi:hypothetical protein